MPPEESYCRFRRLRTAAAFAAEALACRRRLPEIVQLVTATVPLKLLLMPPPYAAGASVVVDRRRGDGDRCLPVVEDATAAEWCRWRCCPRSCCGDRDRPASLLLMPPPFSALLPLIVASVIVAAPSSLLLMPPPQPVAALPDTSEFAMLMLPVQLLLMPPPQPAGDVVRHDGVRDADAAGPVVVDAAAEGRSLRGVARDRRGPGC